MAKSLLYARTISLDARPSVVAQVVGILEERVLPSLEGKADMVRSFVLVDREKGRVISVTLWNSEEAMRADESGKLLQRHLSMLPNFVTPMMISDRYEVATQAEGPAAPKVAPAV